MNEDRLVELFRKLPEQDQNSTIDFMEYLANRKTKQLQEFYTNLPEVNEQFSEEELQQMQNPEFVSLEDASKELGWDNGNSTK